jgi:hypothetical protein
VTRRGRLALLGVAVLLGCASCRMQLDIDVEVHDDGGGVIAAVLAVDADALAKIGGDLASVIALDDLRADGWQIDGPSLDDDGETRLRLEQAYATPEDGEDVLASLTGDDGPLTGFRLGHEEGFWRDRWTFRGQADFSKGAGSAASSIDDEAVQELADQLGSSLDRLIQVRVRVRLPGDVSSNATTRADNGAVWAIGLDDGPVELSAESRKRQVQGYLLVGAGAVLGVVLLVTVLVRLAMRSEHTRR